MVNNKAREWPQNWNWKLTLCSRYCFNKIHLMVRWCGNPERIERIFRIIASAEFGCSTEWKCDIIFGYCFLCLDS